MHHICVDDDRTPIVATAMAANHTYAGTIATAHLAVDGTVLLYAFFHRWPSQPPHMPVLALQPSHCRHVMATCRSENGNNTCCTATLSDPSSPGRHAVIDVKRCIPRPHETSAMVKQDHLSDLITEVDLTFSIQAGADAVRLKLVLQAIICTPPLSRARFASPLPSRVGVCLGPVFRSQMQPKQQRLLWQKWVGHTLASGASQIFAYGIDDHARQFFSEHASSGDSLFYSDWPRRWHELSGLPLLGNASQSSRFSLSTYYVSQALVLQRCFIEHGRSVGWLISMDTDEFWRGDALERFLLAQLAMQPNVGVVSLCRGHCFANGTWAQLASPKYAIRPALCTDERESYAWVHYGACSPGPRPVHKQIFDHAMMLSSCSRVLTEGPGYLDHTFRYCLMAGSSLKGAQPPETPNAQVSLHAWCSPLRCYPQVSYDGMCGPALGSHDLTAGTVRRAHASWS